MNTSQWHRTAAFTLVETMIGVTIIGLLASMSLPAYKKVKETSVATSLASNYRTYASAFEVYATEHGKWPADVGRGVIPPGMEGQLPRFTEPSYMDGRWDWDYRSTKVTAGVTLRGDRIDSALLSKIDAILDDGNLSTGRFILTGSGATYVLEQ